MTETLLNMPLAVLVTFALAGVILNLTPGADVMFATASGLRSGPRVGAAAGLGVGLGGIWQMLMGRALVPVANVLPTIVVTSLLSGAIVGGVGSMFSIRKHLNV